MPTSLIWRFMRAFGNGIWGEFTDRLVECSALVVGILLFLVRNKFSLKQILESRWEPVAIGVSVASAVVIWHAFRGVYAVTKDLRQEERARISCEPQVLKVLSPFGTPIYADTSVVRVHSHPGAKLYGMALCLTGLVITVSAFAWRATKQKDPAAAIGSTSSTSLATQNAPPSGTAEGGYKIKLLFKDSPLFSVARKAAITGEINDFYEYLVEVGFDPPTDVPPIAAPIGEFSDVAGMWSSPRNAKFLTLFIGSKVFVKPEIIRLGYAKYVFDTILFRKYPDDFFNRKSFLDVYAEYFAASFSGVEPEKPVWSPEWITALWEIRRKCGKNFTDRSLMHALSFLDDPNFGAGGPFNTFFYLRFRYGEGVVDNDGKKMIIADQILEKRGLWKPHTN